MSLNGLYAGRRVLRALLFGFFLVAGAAPLAAQQLLTQEEALRLAFPGASRIERRTAYLDDAQLASARGRAGDAVEVRRNVVTYYVGKRGTQDMGFAYFDAHRVRTQQEVLMILVTPAGAVDRVELVQFLEPREYRPPTAWLGRFKGRVLNDNLAVRRDIPFLSGASLTANAVTEATRRVLALHAVITAPAAARNPGR